jgi:D-alanyl-D-alanine carboxypeptidase (penicillin-binding protein 5/6)
VPEAASYVLVDVNTGNVLAGYNERLRLPPASLTKILTALIAVSYLPPNALVPGTAVTEAAYPNDVGIEKGARWPLRDVLQSLLVYSANDAAYAIAERVSGSLGAFGPVMERSALQLGMSGSPIFHDPAGLDGTEGVAGGNLVSARDLAIAGRDLLAVPMLAEIVREESYDFVDPTGRPHDLPSMDYAFLSSYPGAVGIKTGFTDRAGSCIMAAATRKGRTMLAVVMNGYNTTATAMDLLNEGFAVLAGAELTKDRLPPASLPSPLRAHPPRARPPRSFAVRSRSGSRSGLRAQVEVSRTEGTAGLSKARGHTNQTGAVRLTASRGGEKAGLASVVRQWPAKVLLGLAGLAAVLALLELMNTSRARHRHRRTLSAFGPGSGLAASLLTNRRRRDQLVASYARHERQGIAGARAQRPLRAPPSRQPRT